MRGMESGAVIGVLVALLVGLAVGAVTVVVVGRARQQAVGAQSESAGAAAKTEFAHAQTLVAHARSEAAEARSEAAQTRAELAQARQIAADARTEAAHAQAEAAEVSAEVAKAQAERDAAIERARELAADREVLTNQFKVLSHETMERQGKVADAQAEVRLKATEQLMTPVRQSLDAFNLRLTEVEKERVRMSTDLRGQVQAVQQTGEILRRETAALVTALRKPQIRGSWGETQLKRVAELAGMMSRCDFDLQRTTRDEQRVLRPDMIVNLAEGRHVFVDSKVPLSAFLEAMETDDERLRAELLEKYAKHVRTHVDQLSGKQYWRAADTPEFVVLFLPSEAFFAAALEQVPDLYDYAASRDVVIATPTTLIGMLRAIAYGWKQAALAESAAEVFRLGRELHDKLGLMGNKLDKLGRALRSSVNAYNETIATVEGTVLVRARRFRDLKVSEQDLISPSAVEDPVRQIAAPELVEDAIAVDTLIDRNVGRGRRRRALPERDALVRSDPDLLELVSQDVAELGGEEEQERRSS